MANAVHAAGGEIRTSCDVARIQVKGGAATSVVLRNGNEISAKLVISNADPKHTLLNLIEPQYLEPSFLQRLQHYRTFGTVAKMNLALNGLPNFSGIDDNPRLEGRIQISPGDFSRQPYIEATIPSLWDLSLAPAGKHVMSVYMQYAPYKLHAGEWNEKRDELGRTIVQTLAQYAPDLPALIESAEVITPADLERTYGLTGGHIFHGELALDQIFTMRPLLGWAQYATPIRNLYLCGSGTHPGTGLNGLSGADAARQIIHQLRGRGRSAAGSN
jgi:phytoene dehydrogenase-like protein